MKTKNKKKFGFWSYDLFPYVLGAEGVLNKDGTFSPDGYGEGYWFVVHPLLVVNNLKDGQSLKNKLEGLREERRTLLSSVEKGFKARLKELIDLPNN